jgi:replicative DNA helicase
MTTNQPPPHNEAAEKSVLGSVLLDPYAVMFLCQKQGVTADTFYVPAHRLIWEAMTAISATPKVTIDSMIISDELARRGTLEQIGGSQILDRLIDNTPTSAHAAHYIKLVRESEIRRKAIAAIQHAETALYDTGIPESDTVGRLEAELIALQVNSGLEITRLHDYKAAKIEQWRAAKGKGFVGIPSVLSQVNKYLGGWRKQIMAILGGYRGSGKSTLARQECLGLAKQGYKVALFSLEDPGDIAAASIVGNHAGINIFAMDTGSYGNPLMVDQMASAWEHLKELPLWFVAASMTLDQIIATANLLKRQHGIDILWIDHIQLVKPYELPHMNRNNTMAVYSQAIVGLAKSLDIPIVCLSQLTRAPEQGNRKPMLSDLRDSGTLEQDARQVLLLYREDKKFQLEIAKNNFGSSGNKIELNRLDGKQRFEEVSEIKEMPTPKEQEQATNELEAEEWHGRNT